MTPAGDEESGAPPVRVIRARSRRALSGFVDIEYRLNSKYPHWVPPLRRDVRTLLDRLRHPFHEHAEVEYFLALRGGQPVGRIAAIENHAHNVHHNERVGFFGFFDAVNDEAVFRALLRAAETWCRRRGLTAIRGPFSFSTNEQCGQLVENFHCEPFLMMPYHPPYYPPRIEACGYAKAEDLLCFWLDYDAIPDRVFRLADAAQERLNRGSDTPRLRLRTLDMKRWDDELRSVQRIYNSSWSENWGFVPITDREIAFIAKELKPFVVPEMVFFAEIDGEPAAFLLCMPDFNVVLRHLDGRLGPKQILLFLLLRRRIRRARVLMMGVRPEYRGRGLDVILFREIITSGPRCGYWGGELSWILERNKPMVSQAGVLGGELYRRYRIYEKRLG